jgi:hypothetical protein
MALLLKSWKRREEKERRIRKGRVEGSKRNKSQGRYL